MTRSTCLQINAHALLHNLQQIRRLAPGRSIVAMVKANAYGCGLPMVIPALDSEVDWFGVACIEEALIIQQLGAHTPCLLLEGVFKPQDYDVAVAHQMACVIHHAEQLKWLLTRPLSQPIHIWIKIDTGMHRLGFEPEAVSAVIAALRDCPWVNPNLVAMTHFASADEPSNLSNQKQCDLFQSLPSLHAPMIQSMANSAAIIALPQTHADIIRPGLMLYGVSPFLEQTAIDLGLKPVMELTSMIMAVHHYRAGECVGYGGTWQAPRDSTIGVVAIGYGDGYPRHIASNTPVGIHGEQAPIVGRISMDMLTIDLTDCQHTVSLGDRVELWGSTIAIEKIAQSAGTIPYELMCQITSRVNRIS